MSCGTSVWAVKAPMATARSSHVACAQVNGNVMVFGGLDVGFNPLSSVELYDSGANTWTTKAAMPGVKSGTGVRSIELFGGDIIVLGGSFDITSAQAKKVFRYTPGSNSWLTKTDCPVTRPTSGDAVLLLSGIIFMVTSDGAGTMTSAQLYDPAADTWATTAAYPGGLQIGNHARCLLLADGRVLVIGGAASATSFRNTLIYDPGADTWSTRATMLDALYGRRPFGAVRLPSGNVFVTGGVDSGFSPQLTSAVYDPTGNTWTHTADPPSPSTNGIVLVNQCVLAFLGPGMDTSAPPGAACGLYDPIGDAWAASGSLPAARNNTEVSGAFQMVGIAPFSINDPHPISPFSVLFTGSGDAGANALTETDQTTVNPIPPAPAPQVHQVGVAATGNDITLGNQRAETGRFNFVRGPDGDVAFDDTEAHSVMTSAMEDREGYWADATHGSTAGRLHSLTGRTPSLAQAATLDALAQQEREGSIKDLAVAALADRGRLTVTISWTTAGGESKTAQMEL